jgi:hypothetical protein
MTGMKRVSDEETVKWIFEDSELEGEFSDEGEHEETVSVFSDNISSESECKEFMNWKILVNSTPLILPNFLPYHSFGNRIYFF